MSTLPPNPITIERWRDTSRPQALIAGIEAVFFETAGTQAFQDAATREAFRDRWLGRYLSSDPDHVWLALTAEGAIAGYLVGCLDDPALTPRFADIGYFQSIAHLTWLYPAHLHINLSARYRSDGTGSRLIEAFVATAARAGSPGLHVVTGAGMRNVGFYGRNGFLEVARFSWPPSPPRERELVMLARRLA